MMALIQFLFNNPALMASVVAIIGGFLLYMRGYTSGKTAEKDRSNKAIELIDEGIRKAEMANQKLEREQRSNEKAVHDADSIPDLIGLWSKSSSKATDDSPNKSK